MLPRDAFFAAKETVVAGNAAGRICAEQIILYPAGIQVIIPGERITTQLLDYLRSGLAAGMQLPDPADPSLATPGRHRNLVPSLRCGARGDGPPTRGHPWDASRSRRSACSARTARQRNPLGAKQPDLRERSP